VNPQLSPAATTAAERAGLPDELFADLSAGDLNELELRELVDRIAERPDLWGPHVAYDDEHRHYVSLHRDSHVDVWVLCWTPVNDTGWHDHDVSSGAVAVVHGCVSEHNLVIGGRSLETDVARGGSFCFGPDHIHRMTGRDRGSVSIHAYSPPLWRMGQYSLSPDGVLRRTSVSYADELRPLDEVDPEG
jgi:hypothetical protein